MFIFQINVWVLSLLEVYLALAFFHLALGLRTSWPKALGLSFVFSLLPSVFYLLDFPLLLSKLLFIILIQVLAYFLCLGPTYKRVSLALIPQCFSLIAEIVVLISAYYLNVLMDYMFIYSQDRFYLSVFYLAVLLLLYGLLYLFFYIRRDEKVKEINLPISAMLLGSLMLAVVLWYIIDYVFLRAGQLPDEEVRVFIFVVLGFILSYVLMFLRQLIQEQKNMRQEKALEQLRSKQKEYEQVSPKETSDFWELKIKETTYRLRFSDIFFLSVQNHHVEIHLQDSVLSLYATLSGLKETLPEQFVYSHRSFLVNTDRVSSLSRNALVFDNAAEVPVSKSYYPNLRSSYPNLQDRLAEEASLGGIKN